MRSIGGVKSNQRPRLERRLLDQRRLYHRRLVDYTVAAPLLLDGLGHRHGEGRRDSQQPALIPLGRFGTVGDVVVMLATNGYITGQTINVNGGWCMS